MGPTRRRHLRVCAGIAFALLAGATATTNAAEPSKTGDYRSKHFLVHTDLPPSAAKDLLNRLESMIELVADYWQRPPHGTIECYVVERLDRWPDGAFDADVLRKIRRKSGVTLTDAVRQDGKKLSARSIVYAAAGDTPLHEAVHAYLEQNFESQGPTWYSEGMAEMGRFWRKDDTAVRAPEWIIAHLRKAETPRVGDLVGPAAVTGDAWQAYAWRWALCHLLVHNPNFSERFRQLGRRWLEGENDAFAQVFADDLPRIEWEYRLFLANIAAGYRVDLCRWDWTLEFREPNADAIVETIEAARGWQPSGAKVSRRQSYAYKADGKWRIAPTSTEVRADGDKAGHGRLVGAILSDGKLGAEFDLGTAGSFVAQTSGDLYLRCRDQWHELADNRGTVTFAVRAVAK